MGKILGIDLGTNSIGWAIRDTSEIEDQITDYGVVTFEKGVASEKGIEFPKVKKRTESRSKRRNYQAEKYRKYKLLEFLIDKEMCPLKIEELDKWRKYKKGETKKYPQSVEFINWIRYDFDGDGKPDFYLFDKNKHDNYYVFRALIIDEKYKDVFQSNKQIIGRVLYQLVQRRGFKGRDEEEAKTMLLGSQKNNTKGRNEIEEYIIKYKTLGAALYYFQKERGERIRKRYNLRKDFENELIEICKIQNLNEEEYKKLWKCIIWQRDLRTQKGLIGNCIFEKNKKRAPISHPLYEEYRTWIFINNLNIVLPENIDKEKYLNEVIYPYFSKFSSDFELIKIKKQLIDDGGYISSNFTDDTKVKTNYLQKNLNDIYGKEWKSTLLWDKSFNRDSHQKKKTNLEYNYEDIWHILQTFNSKENIKLFSIEKLNLDEEKAEKLSKLKLNSGFATLSLSAIKKILLYLKKGFLYSHAVYFANISKVLDLEFLDQALEDELINDFNELIKDYNHKKELNSIVNNLISKEVASEFRYRIDDNRELDTEEISKINEEIISYYGNTEWSLLEENIKFEIIAYIKEHFYNFLKKSILEKSNLFIKMPRLHDVIFDFLKEKFNVSEDKRKYLWHPSEQENYTPSPLFKQFRLHDKDVFISENKIADFNTKYPNTYSQGYLVKQLLSPMPLSKGFKNPMALKSLHKLKHLINYLLQIGKVDEDTRIVIEIARELNDANKRKAIEKWNKEREKENESYKNIIEEINKECGTKYDSNDKTLLKKIRLWQEQGRICLYTGKTIGLCDVFDGNKFDIEHTIPISLSFDSELKNLTLADKGYNEYKRKTLPANLSNYNNLTVINGIEIPPIIMNMENLFGKRIEKRLKIKGKEKTIISWEKIDNLEYQYEEWKNKASYATTKEIKDSCIQKYHFIKMDLDYWKQKLNSFTIIEYKSSWRNSQLRDTQIITKYALPYLKTVFNKVEVEKPTVVEAFKEIYNVKLPFEKKNRSNHSHHAIDAAILTLIPPFYLRDKILQKYFDAKEILVVNTYHELPKDWKNFSASKILKIENGILINNLAEHRTLLVTAKKVRKRGKIVYGNINKNDKMPWIAKGDTIRGQLHGESFYGAIKLPFRDENNKIKFDENKKMILHDEIFTVIRKPLVFKTADGPGFKSIDDIEKVIVDKDLFNMIKTQVEESDFKTAMSDGIYMLDKHGNKVNKIRRVRCKDTSKYNSLLKVHKHYYVSDKEYKRNTLAVNGENSLCLFYKNEKGKAMKIQTISQLANTNILNDSAYFNEEYFRNLEIGKGKNKFCLPLYAILKSRQKVIFYKNAIEEVKELIKDNNYRELSKRMYIIYQFESDNRIKFRHHLLAGIDSELKKVYPEYSYVDLNIDQKFLRLSQGEWNFAIENFDFIFTFDGKILFN